MCNALCQATGRLNLHKQSAFEYGHPCCLVTSLREIIIIGKRLGISLLGKGFTCTEISLWMVVIYPVISQSIFSSPSFSGSILAALTFYLIQRFGTSTFAEVACCMAVFTMSSYSSIQISMGFSATFFLVCQQCCILYF